MLALPLSIFGLVIGSFLNVVILRHGVKTIGGRSGCLSCGAQLCWYDMLPVVSWIALTGRCRSCGSSISPQYPLVELSTAALFGLLGASPLSLELLAVSLVIAALLILISVYDLRHTIIPDEWSYAFAILSFAASVPFALHLGIEGGIIPLIIAGPLCALPLFALWLFSRGRWMGLGDAKLALGIGYLLGMQSGLIAVFFAFVIGALISVCILLPYSYVKHILSRGKGITRLGRGRERFTMKSEVPFGPFLVMSTIVIWLLGIYGLPIPFLPIT